MFGQDTWGRAFPILNSLVIINGFQIDISNIIPLSGSSLYPPS